MSDLEQLLRDERDLRARELAARLDSAPPHAFLAATSAAVRRRRRIRAASVACASVLVVAGIGVGAWAVTNDPSGPLMPITPPSPTSSPTPSATPTPTPTPSESPAPGAEETLTAAVAQEIGKGWVVGIREVDGVRHAAAVSPAGVVYRGPDVSDDVLITGWMYELGFAAESWLSDEPRLSDEPSGPGAIDAQTGELTTLHSTGGPRADLREAFGADRLPKGVGPLTLEPYFVGQTRDGTIVWAAAADYGMLVGLALERPDGSVEPLVTNDLWIPGDEQGEVWEGIVVDSEAGTLYLEGAGTAGVTGPWLVDIAANTYAPVQPAYDVPCGGWLYEGMRDGALLVSCADAEPGTEYRWLPLDGSPSAPAGPPTNVPTTEDWVTFAVVP